MTRQLAKINAPGKYHDSEIYTVVYDDTQQYNPYIVYLTTRDYKDRYKPHRKKLAAFCDYMSCLFFIAEKTGIRKE